MKYGLVSVDGGSGKTTLCLGLAAALAARGHTVSVVGLGSRTLALAAGVADAPYDLADVLAGRAGLDEALVPLLPNVTLLPPPRVFTEVMSVRNLCCGLPADFVLIDGPPGDGHQHRLVAEACDILLMVAAPPLYAPHPAARTKPARLILNRVHPHLIHLGHEPSFDEAIDTIGVSLLGVVQEDEMIPALLRSRTPIVHGAQDFAAAALVRIAERLCGEDVPLPQRLRVGRVDG